MAGSSIDALVDWGVPLALAVACLVVLILLAQEFGGDSGQKRRFKRRLARIGRYRDLIVGSGADVGTGQRLATESVTPGLDRIASRWLPRQAVLRVRLEKTGRPITIGRYMVAMGAIAIAIFALGHFILGLGLLPAGLLGAASGIGLPHLWIGRLGRIRVSKFTALLPEALDLMIRALRSGLPITEAMLAVGRELADPIGGEFRRVEQALKVGRPLDDVLWEMAERLDTPEFGFFVISLSVQRQTGGNLAETLSNLAEILRRRRQMRQKIRAISGEARMSALILGILPFVVAVLIFVTTPGYLVPLFTDPNGIALLVFGGVMLCIGAFIMARLIRFEI
jgi:tight adherence protein B